MIYITVATILLFVSLRQFSIFLEHYGRRFPPSPPSDPLIGHLRRLPSKDLDMYLYSLGKKLGNIFNIRIPGQNLLVLNAVQPALDLLEGRSAYYSDRPRAPLAELCGMADTAAFLNLGDEFRLHRKILNKHLAKGRFQSPGFYSSLQYYGAVMARKVLCDKSENMSKHFLFYSSAITVELAFGHRIDTKNNDDPYLKITSDAALYAFPAVKPHGSELIDVFPFLTKLPSWIPLNKHVTNAIKAGKLFHVFRKFPYADVRKKMDEGRAAPCFLVSELTELQDGSSKLTPQQIEAIISVLFIGGIETTATSLSILSAALLLYPEAQAKAQEEIERVVGNDRLPNFSDRNSLPYVECLFQEILRWNPTVPLGLPHVSRKDDTYNGYDIPKGTAVVANIRGMSLDESVYKDPSTFYPSRFLPQPEGRGEPHFSSVFGFGRRVCPGRYLVLDTLWIAAATFLAALTISRPKDALGQEYVPEIEWEVSLTSRPKPFSCHISARNSKMKSVLEIMASSQE